MNTAILIDKIQNALSAVTEGEVLIKEETASTNDDAKALVLAGAPHGSLVLALSQTKGRGRWGRNFSSHTGGLYLSFIVKNGFAVDPARLTVSAAVAAVRAIEQVSTLSVGIKWVNDLYVIGKKCGGILAEGVFDGSSHLPIAAVIGIGINLNNPLPEELTPIAVSLSKAGANVGLQDMAVAICKEFMGVYAKNAEFPIEEYRNRSVLIGKTLTVNTTTESYPAKVVGITDKGELTVLCNGITKNLSGGEVSLHSMELEV